MQPDVVTLPVDEQNDGVDPVDHVFQRFEEYQNRAVYIGPNHSMTARNLLGLYRTPPKPSGNFRGVAKTAAKFTKDIVVVGADGISQLTVPMIYDLSVALPVGATAEAEEIARMTLVALLKQDAIMIPLIRQLMV